MISYGLTNLDRVYQHENGTADGAMNFSAVQVSDSPL